MPTILRKSSWPLVSKPPLGCSIDTGHPLARGLVSCVPLNEGAGMKVYDHAQRRFLDTGALSFPSSGWAMTPAGVGVKFTDNAAHGIRVGLSGYFKDGMGMTLFGI